MKSNHVIGAFLAVAIVLGTSTAVMAKKLPWPYGDRAMNELAMRTYAQQQAEKAGMGYYNNPYGVYNNNYNNLANPYPYGYGNGYGVQTPGYYGAAPLGGWY